MVTQLEVTIPIDEPPGLGWVLGRAVTVHFKTGLGWTTVPGTVESMWRTGYRVKILADAMVVTDRV